jgi:uncharacterized protein (DUF1015 family)
MATIAPFRGIRYHKDKVGDISAVVTLPYDRITPELQEKYYATHPHSIVRIILGKEEPGDNERSNKYTRARDYFNQWLSESILIQDPNPAIYAYHQEYRISGGPARIRHGFIAALRLEPFESGIVLPHERTLSKPKADRLNLLRATETNFGNIFLLYPDKENRINAILEHHTQREPDIVAVEPTEGDIVHRVWKINDADTIQRVVAEMESKSVMIADGHHRYETALNYRNEMREVQGVTEGEMPYDYCMATFVSTDDPGLVILPTHRLVHNLASFDPDQFRADASAYFDISEVTDLKGMLQALSETGGHCFGAYVAKNTYWMLSLKGEDIINHLTPADRSQEWRTLDVTILHAVVIEHLLGISPEKVASQENIKYLRDPEQGVTKVDSGEAQLCLYLNPTKPEQVRIVAEKGDRMPQKSTDFYPKLIAGLVFYSVTTK